MTQELAQKSEEIRKYEAEYAVVLSRVGELVGHLGEVVNKALTIQGRLHWMNQIIIGGRI